MAGAAACQVHKIVSLKDVPTVAAHPVDAYR